LHTTPLLDEILRLRTDFDLEGFIEEFDIDKKSADSEDFLASLKLKVTEGKESTPVIGSSFKIFDISEFVEEPLHQIVAALLRYILDKHFLPNFLFWSHLING
jgi:hypothetical protein